MAKYNLVKEENKIMNKVNIYIKENINTFTTKKVKIKRFINLSEVVNDRGNEMLFLFFIVNDNEEDYEFTELNIRKFSEFVENEFEFIHLDSYFTLNTEIILPVTYLK